MKKRKLLTIALATALALTGCGRTDTITEDIPELHPLENPENTNPSQGDSSSNPTIIDNAEVMAYKVFLEKYLEEHDNTFYVALMRLDENKTYELAILNEEGPNMPVYLYGYKDGEVISLETDGNPFYGMDGDFKYFNGKNSFYYEYLNAQGDSADFNEMLFHLEQGMPVFDHSICHKTDYETKEVTYIVDDKEVTEAVYKSDYEHYVDPPENYYSEFTTLSSKYAIKVEDEESLVEALSVDYRSLFMKDEISAYDFDEVKKPVIYLYPEEDGTEITAELDIDGYYTELIPEFNSHRGWTVTADRNGDIHLDGTTYDYLFWEAELNTDFNFDEGFCIPGAETESFLEWALTNSGLNEKEKQQFIEYWLPEMAQNEYNVISFQTTAYTDHAALTVTPAPDTMLRVFMAYYGSDEFVEMQAQTLTAPERTGFTVVEWGGSCIR